MDNHNDDKAVCVKNGLLVVSKPGLLVECDIGDKMIG